VLSMPLAKFVQRVRFDRAFKVQVQFSLGQESQETTRRPVGCGGRHFLIVVSWRKICEAGQVSPFPPPAPEQARPLDNVHMATAPSASRT
jgi:hypothetical protein